VPAEGVLRWGLLGTARINRAIIPALRQSSKCALVAVASRDASRAAAFAAQWAIDEVVDSYTALLMRPDIDVVYVPLPNSQHAEWTIRAAQAGKHVLCEKPLALSVQDVDAIAAAADLHDVVVTEAFMYRHHPQTHLVRRLIEAGTIGRVRYLRGSFTFPLTSQLNIRLDPLLGGGSLWDVGCYPISWARAVLGQEAESVFGWARRCPTGVDESFAGQIQFPGDVHMQFDCGFTMPFRTSMEVVGAEGVLSVERPFKPAPRGVIRVTRGDDTTVYTTEEQELYLGEVEDLVDAIIQRRAPLVTLEDSRRTVATLVALYESARRGEMVEVAPPAQSTADLTRTM
jgi:D-xylose 1-dehydrogenase (NADP+, D-xylono-1,5-lactone-forming)